MEVRGYVDGDARPMQELQSRLWPRADFHPGGLGWSLATDQMGGRTLVAGSADRVVGWIAQPGQGELTGQVEPGADAAAGSLVAAATDAAEHGQLRIPVIDQDETLRAALRHHGFAETGDVTYGMFLDTAPVTGLKSADYSVRSAGPDEASARVGVHRAAWRPRDMPWPGEHQSDIDPEATSSFTEAKYARCRATWLYDPEFDLVAVASDGSFAACCLAWFDPSTGVAEVEPMGVHPDHRRRGLAAMLCHEVARRVAARGGSQVYIHSGPNPAYPAPPAAYTKAGFRTQRRGTVLVRPA